MQNQTRWRAFSLAIVVASLAVFGFFAYAGSVSGVHCAIASATAACEVRTAMSGIDAFSDYLYAVLALLLGQIVLLSAWLIRKSR